MEIVASLVASPSRSPLPQGPQPAADSTSLDLAPFDLAHLADLAPLPLLRRPLQLFATSYRPAGPALTFVEGGRVIGCAGLQIDGVQARAWAFFSAPLRRRSLKALHRSFKRSLPMLKRLHRLESIRAEAHPDHAFARRWLEHLGFRFDGVGARCPQLGERMLRYRYR